MGLASALEYVDFPGNERWGGNFLTISIQPRYILGGHNVSEPGSQVRHIAALLSASVATNVPDGDRHHDTVGAPF